MRRRSRRATTRAARVHPGRGRGDRRQDGAGQALVGGRSFKDSKFDRAVQAKRQPGSCFKPFIYTAAIENGYTPSDILLDAPIVLDLPNGDVWKPQNYTETYEGEVTLRHALNVSINIAAIRLLMAMGPTEAINVAHRLGIKSDLENVYSLALGVSEVTSRSSRTPTPPLRRGACAANQSSSRKSSTVKGACSRTTPSTAKRFSIPR